VIGALQKREDLWHISVPGTRVNDNKQQYAKDFGQFFFVLDLNHEEKRLYLSIIQFYSE
jgi:hypothetical protein